MGTSLLSLPAITAWLAGPPSLRTEAQLLTTLVDDLLGLLKPYAVRSVWTSEPRIYRTGPRGRALLADALADNRVTMFILASQPGAMAAGHAAVTVNLGQHPEQPLATSVDLSLQPYSDAAWWTVAAQLTEFVTRWFAPLQAAAAFVSTSSIEHHQWHGDTGTVTAYERERHLPSLSQWPDLRRYLRGAFWGTGLGPDLCAQLGGQDRVLHEAPVTLAQRLDHGLWLQLSEIPPAEPAALARLAAYLAPLLEWTRADVLAGEAEARARQAYAESAASVEASVSSGMPEPATSHHGGRRRAVPMRLIGEPGTDVGLNVYLATPPTPSQRVTVETALEAWYRLGSTGAFGGAGFHDVIGPSADGAVLRWLVDLGSADDRRALRALAEQLAELPGVTVERLVVGTERAL